MIKCTSVAPVMCNTVHQPTVVRQSRKIGAKELDFLDTFQPIYYFLRSFGLMPFSIKRNASETILDATVNKFDGAWFVTSILIYLIATVDSVKYVNFQRKVDTKFDMLVILNNSRLTMLFCVLIIGMDMCNRVKLVHVVKQIILFDRQVSYLFILVFIQFFLINAFLHFHAKKKCFLKLP